MKGKQINCEIEREEKKISSQFNLKRYIIVKKKV